MLRLVETDPVSITRRVVDATLTARRVSARYGRSVAERSTLVDQLRPGTRVRLTSDAFIGALEVVVIESAPSLIDLIDENEMGHELVRRAEGWRLRRFGCVDVSFEVEILCEVTTREPEDAYAMIVAQAYDDDDLCDQLSSHAFELAKQATGLQHAGKLSGDIDDARICAAVVLFVGEQITHVLVNTFTGDVHVALASVPARLSINLEGDVHETTLESFLDDNRDSFDEYEKRAIATLKVGESYGSGGGAHIVWTATRIA